MTPKLGMEVSQKCAAPKVIDYKRASGEVPNFQTQPYKNTSHQSKHFPQRPGDTTSAFLRLSNLTRQKKRRNHVL